MGYFKVLVAASALMAWGIAATAQESGGVRVHGNTNLNVNAQNVDTMAVGQNTVAKTNIGTVNASRSGSQNITVDAKNVQNIVGGRGKKGCINIGTHGTDPDCQ
ncbi:MAG: hypothetical protein ACM3Q1_18420 [Bacteroidales bacterium]